MKRVMVSDDSSVNEFPAIVPVKLCEKFQSQVNLLQRDSFFSSIVLRPYGGLSSMNSPCHLMNSGRTPPTLWIQHRNEVEIIGEAWSFSIGASD